MSAVRPDLPPFTLLDVRDALGFLSPDMPRKEWAVVGMAIKSEFGEDGFEVWDAWSEGGSEYSRNDARNTWRSIKGDGAVSLGTLVKLAMNAGWKPQRQEISEEERRRRAREAEERRVRRAEELAREAAATAAWHNRIALFSLEVWEQMGHVGRSPYLGAKRVRSYGLRFAKRGMVLVTDSQAERCELITGKDEIKRFFDGWDPKAEHLSVRYLKSGTLAVPMRDLDGKLWGLQLVFEGGGKKFLRHGRKAGTFHQVGEIAEGSPLVLCEGYADMASVHEATGWPGMVTWDVGNLETVAAQVRERFPHLPFVFAGDDDHEREDGNIGRVKAEAAAKRFGGRALFPTFREPKGRKDWNDLHQEQGLSAVREQLLEGAQSPALVPEPEDRPPPETLESVPPPPPGGHGGEPPSDEADEWRFDLDVLLRDYVLIYGTETVFDGRRCQIISLSALRAAAGKSLVRMWLEHPGRRIVPQTGVVFDPAGGQRAGTVNLFRGWPLEPKAGDCGELLELLYYLVGRDTAVFDWVLKWSAYPLQHPGAKMQTAVIFHGPEGTGKNTWWGAVQAIYGDYAGIITQQELESQFNGWASGKLFIIGNEVVSRQEMYHQKGRLRNMITEPSWPINEKNLPVRWEANHANFVFLSNEFQPAAPSPDDRRYLVVWTPPKLDVGFYTQVKREIAGGGVEALYHYLLNLPLGDFGEHTMPPWTEAKGDLIDASMDSHERFFRQWQAGDLPVAYVPCISLDLYRAYRKWCDERGERAPAREAVFLASMGKRADKRVERYIPPSGGQRAKQGTVIIPRGLEPAQGVSRQAWLTELVGDFSQQLKDWG